MDTATTLSRMHPDYANALTGFQLGVRREPDAVVVARTPDDVRDAVALAAHHDLPVAVEATGHGRAVHVDGGLLVNTRGLDGVRVDAERRTAWVEAGARWRSVIDAAARYGLAPLSGSSPDVGAVGYTLGGGLPLLSRRYGYAADHVLDLDVVTADGRRRRVSADAEPDLFRAMRGGRGNFGIAVGMRIALFPLDRLYGGGLYFTGELVPAALHTWLDWTARVPDEMSSALALVPIPDVPGVPDPLRGRYVAHVRVAYTGDAAAGERLVAPLREVGPCAIDTLGELSYRDSGSIYNDPPRPHAYCGTGLALDRLDATAADAVLRLAGPDAPVPCVVQVRHLGGALRDRPAVPNCVGHRDAAYLLSVLSPLSGVDADTARDRHEALAAALSGCVRGRFLNYLYGTTATPEQIRAAYESDDYRLLTQLKFRYDPRDMFRLDHPIPPEKLARPGDLAEAGHR